MRKIFYLVCIIMLFVCNIGNAQSLTGYSVTGSSIISPSTCAATYIQVNVAGGYGVGFHVKTTYQGILYTSVVTSTMSGLTANFMFNLYTPGNYTFKMILEDTSGSGTDIDSIICNFTKLNCSFSNFGLFNDINGNCVYDTGDYPIYNPALIEISLSGTPIDTVSSYNNLNFMNNSTPGTVYTYRLLQPPVGAILSCPLSGIINDTVGIYNVPKRFGFICSSATNFDLQGFVSVRCGITRAESNVIIKNTYCNTIDADVKILFSPKYNFMHCTYTPAYTMGSISSWHFPLVSTHTPKFISVLHYFSTIPLTYGDTVNSRYELTPTAGDVAPSNNIIVRVDTVKASYDPNDISVYPSGNIFAGTELEYTIRFENTGNDTAFNIHILDTLSNNVNFNTLKVAAASHNMNVTQYTSGTNNIVKFDFPNINLLDSSHHGECSGMVVFNVSAKNGLPYGTQIFNRAGIYFDYNPVVMTNTVENIIPYPDDIAPVHAIQNAYLYPNPTGELLNIKTGNSLYTSACITNTLGQTLATYELTGSNTQVNVKALPMGLYFISLLGAKGVDVQKFEKQ